MFGLPNKAERNARADRAEKESRQWATKAEEYGSKAAAHRRDAASGRGGDRAADRAIASQYEGNQRVCAANARDFAEIAKQSRRGLFR